MIREFFSPRVFLIFAVLWALCWFGLLAYLHSTKQERRRFIRASTAPILAALASLVIVIAVLAFLTVFD